MIMYLTTWRCEAAFIGDICLFLSVLFELNVFATKLV